MKRNIKNIKLKAFTLPELIITMILVLLLFLLGSEAYNIVAKQVGQIQEKYSFYTQDYLEEKVVQKDFDKADLIRKNVDGELELLSDSGAVTYLFDSNYIVRQTKKSIDTLMPGGVIVTTKYYRDTSNLISYIKILHRYKQKPFYTFLAKDYSSEQLLHYYFTENNEDERAY